MSDAHYAFSSLDRLFHAPARLSIATALYSYGRGMTFSQLKEACELSDGNLSRHVSRMVQGSVVRSDKIFVDRMPQTTVTLTVQGRGRFEQYIESLRRIVEAQEISAAAKYTASSSGIVYD